VRISDVGHEGRREIVDFRLETPCLRSSISGAAP